MDNKLSELSKPACQMEMSDGEMKNLYSQEYVSALLAEIERGNGYLADVRYAKGCCENAIAVREKRIAELEAKLATPVRLNASTVMSRRYVVEAIRAAGFTVEGDE